jgi:bifunctional enzyme CysN/CysC
MVLSAAATLGRHRGVLGSPRAQGTAALHHLRQRRRRQVVADRAAAVRIEDDLRGPAGGAGERLQESRHAGRELDYALLVDGLAAEREQGITIDVAYRFFSTERRKFIVADTPGHEQYTRNMVTGASTADLAVILIDARKGVLTQTRRHSYLVSLLGIRRIVLAVNKMDLVGYSEMCSIPSSATTAGSRAGSASGGSSQRFPFRRCAATTSSSRPRTDALVSRADAARTPRDPYRSRSPPSAQPFRMPVQWVNRPDPDFRGFAGLIAGGSVSSGDAVRVLPSGEARARGAHRDCETRRSPQAVAGQSVTLTLRGRNRYQPRRCAVRGGCAGRASPISSRPRSSGCSDEPMLHRAAYLLKSAPRPCAPPWRRLQVSRSTSTRSNISRPRQLELNEIGVWESSSPGSAPWSFEPYATIRDTGRFHPDRSASATIPSARAC